MSHRKPHSGSKIAKLPREQQELLESWLFDENIAYRKAADRALAQFGVKMHPVTVMCFYHKIRQQRNLDRILRSVKYADEVAKACAENPDETAKAIGNVVGQIAFTVAVSKSEEQAANKCKPVGLRHLSDAVEIYLTTREDSREAQKVSLEREKWEFDVVRLVQQHHAALEKISKDESLDEDARLLAIRKSLFGEVVPE